MPSANLTSRTAPRLHGHLTGSASRSAAALVGHTTRMWARVLTDPLGPAAGPRLAADALRWVGHVVDRDRPSWSSPHEIVFETPIARLRDFTEGAADDVVPTLVLPPQAGHDSCIVDYSREQSQMAVIRAVGLTRAYALDWVGATAATRHTTVEDYIAVITRAVDEIGGPVNLVGDCQGGWLAAIYAALHPENVNTLTLAGSPIDFHAGDAVIHGWTSLLSRVGGMAPYRALVALGGGNMPGRFVLDGFIAIRPEAEIDKQLMLLENVNDPEHVSRYAAFENWFKHTQDLPGDFYLWIVEHLFRDNELFEGRLVVGGRRVDLSDISCPLYLLAGATDHITPPRQVFRSADAVSTPAADVTMRTTSGGHLGLFMGREALREHWPVLMAGVFEHSVPSAAAARPARSGAASRRGKARTAPRPAQPAIPVP